MYRGLFLFFVVCQSIVSAQNPAIAELKDAEWTILNPFSGGPRDDGSGFSIDGNGYYGCGNNFSFQLQNDWWRYDPSEDSWEEVSGIPGQARQYSSAFSNDSIGLLLGGVFADGSPTNEVLIYEPLQDNWTVDSMPIEGRFKAVGFRIGERIFYGFGQNDSALLDDFWEYNISRNVWTELESPAVSSRSEMIGFSALGYGYIGLGQDTTKAYADLWRYSPTDNSWTKLDDYPGGARTYAAAVEEMAGAIVGGGQDENGDLVSEAYHFDANTSTWTQIDDLENGPVRGMDGFRIGAFPYFVGGLTDNFTRVNYVQKLRYNSERSKNVVRIWPTPARSGQNIYLKAAHFSEGEIQIFDVSGYKVLDHKLSMSQSTHMIEAGSLMAGIYVVRVTINEIDYVQKMLIMH